MPQPKPGETKKDYLKRCIPELIHEGREQKQSVAICHAIYDKHNNTNNQSTRNHKNHKKENMSKSDKTKLYVAHY